MPAVQLSPEESAIYQDIAGKKASKLSIEEAQELMSELFATSRSLDREYQNCEEPGCDQFRCDRDEVKKLAMGLQKKIWEQEETKMAKTKKAALMLDEDVFSVPQ